MTHRPLGLLAVLALTLPAAVACTSTGDGAASGPKTVVDVTSTESSCDISSDSSSSGNLVFKVKNEGDRVTEFYLYAENGEDVVGEVENIGPGLTRELTAQVDPGNYVTACKPGMEGDGIRADFTVTEGDSAAG
jgi:iron uptake system component EfeO